MSHYYAPSPNETADATEAGYNLCLQFPTAEQQESLVQQTAELGDEKLHKQILHVNAMAVVYKSTVEMQQRWVAREQRVLDDEWVLRCHNAWNAGHILEVSLRDKEKLIALLASDKTAVFHLGDVERKLAADAATSTEAVFQCNRRFMKSIWETWSVALESTGNRVVKMCPEGWRAIKDSIMAVTDLATIARKSLLTNPEYVNIGGASAELEALYKCAKRLNAQCPGPAINSSIMGRANDAIVEATETVAITYALYSLTVKISVMKHLTTRREEIEKLKKRIGSKGVVLGPSLETYCQTLLKRKGQKETEENKEEEEEEGKPAAPEVPDAHA